MLFKSVLLVFLLFFNVFSCHHLEEIKNIEHKCNITNINGIFIIIFIDIFYYKPNKIISELNRKIKPLMPSNPKGYYYAIPELPNGLNIDFRNGIISGTVKESSISKYNIIYYNGITCKKSSVEIITLLKTVNDYPSPTEGINSDNNFDVIACNFPCPEQDGFKSVPLNHYSEKECLYNLIGKNISLCDGGIFVNNDDNDCHPDFSINVPIEMVINKNYSITINNIYDDNIKFKIIEKSKVSFLSIEKDKILINSNEKEVTFKLQGTVMNKYSYIHKYVLHFIDKRLLSDELCGNNICDVNENCGNCPNDCGDCPPCIDSEETRILYEQYRNNEYIYIFYGIIGGIISVLLYTGMLFLSSINNKPKRQVITI